MNPAKRSFARPAAAFVALAITAGPALLSAGPAAAVPQETIFDASSDLLGTAASPSSSARRAATLEQLDALGADAMRLVVPWRNVAPKPNSRRRPAGFDPSDPTAYPQDAFRPVDEAIRGAFDHGLDVLLVPSTPIPDWASSSATNPDGVTSPRPAEFEHFVTALGLRYSGNCALPLCIGIQPLPRVRFWAALNEPNLPIFLQPQSRRGKPVAPALYRRLFLAAQRGLRASGHGSDPLLIGETSPGPGRGGTAPLDFLRGVLCLDARYRPVGRCAPIRAAGWAHHPYDPRDPPFAKPKDLLMTGTIGRLTSALKRAARAGATKGRLPVYVTEYGIQSVPDRDFGVSEQRQLEYLGIGEFLLWRNPQVRAYAQYLLTDDSPSFQFAFTTGLRFAGGGRKASYDAFPITLAVRRSKGRVQVWGHVRPGSGPYEVEVRVRDGDLPARQLRTLATDPDGYFAFSDTFAAARRWRAICRLPGGRLLKGPFVRAYSFR